MADVHTRRQRSFNMSRIRSTDTKPESMLRSRLHSAGYRFRKNVRELPGSPDIVLPKYRTVILVHGCFWHRHKGCKFAATPKSNVEFWDDKFQGNVERDRRNVRALRDAGWDVETIWECEIRSDLAGTIKRVEAQLKLKAKELGV